MKARLAIISTHPIQYNAPLFKMLSERGNIDIKVFYTWGDVVLKNKYDPGFGQIVHWDVPLLDGYAYEFVHNVSAKPGSHHFSGINNPGLIAAIEKWRASAVLIYGWAFRSHLACMRHFKNRRPVLFRGDSTLTDKRGVLSSILRLVSLKWIYGFVDKALYVGKKNRDYFLEFGLAENNLVFAPHAVDNNRFKPTAETVQNANAIKTNLGIPENAVVFLFAGKMEQKKDPLLLVDAFPGTENTNMHLVMAGDGEMLTAVKQAASGRRNIHFLPFQNQSGMPALYQVADVFILPSRGPGETWGLAVNEAMAAGKAALVSDACGCAADLVQDGVNGFVFKSGCKQDLGEKITTLANAPGMARQMGIRSTEIIQGWNYNSCCEAIENLLKA